MHIHRLEQPEGRCGQVHHDGAACQLFPLCEGKECRGYRLRLSPVQHPGATFPRDMKNVERSESLQQLLCRQYERTGKKAYPVLTSGPGKVLETADRLSGNSDILFFDLPGTVNTPGILEAIINMDYVFTPVVQDRMVMQSSLSFRGRRSRGFHPGNILKHR